MRGFGQSPAGDTEFTPLHRAKYEAAVAEFRARRRSPVARQGTPSQQRSLKRAATDDAYPEAWKRKAPGEVVLANFGAPARDGVDDAYPAHWKR
jgi:hypothetical protein